mmetsp:Transcript_44532/g.93166  ORF Transcript_44532/g.93166 Transcript_44532/m.93166 type:complete len:112 (-) Transcript_44532:545-880(-)
MVKNHLEKKMCASKGKMSKRNITTANDDIDLMKVVELRSELKSRKLSTTGLKSDLVDRLKKAIQAEPVSSQQSSDSKDRVQLAGSNDEGGWEDSGSKASNSLELYSSSGMC